VSCGDPHDTDCSEVLAEVWLYLDHECECERRELLRQHLDECSPCLARYGLEEQLKELLARKCGGDQAPETLRERLRDSIRTVMIEQAEVTVERDEDGTTVEVRMTRTDLHEA
jgi:mycothiol system anti-sigma-R factor